MNNFEKKMINDLWEYPLFEALARRRSFRFPLGCEVANAPFSYKSEKEPVALSELEQAILCWAGHGITGTIMSDLDASTHTMNHWIGHTHPNPCNDQKQDLMFFDDTGAYLYRPKAPEKNVEFQTPEDRQKILGFYEDSLVKIVDGRPNLPEFGYVACNHWNANKPGTTTFMPIVDITYEYMNFLLLACSDDRWQLFDDRAGTDAGLKKWIDNGYLNGPPVPLSYLETAVATACMATAHYMIQNIALAATSMGLAYYPYSAYVSMVLMGGTPLTPGFGFRFKTGKDKIPTPVGKDGFVEPLCPPYVDNMDEAVEKFWNDKFNTKGMFGSGYEGVTPWKDDALYLKVRKPNEESKEVAKAFLNYLYNTYGRFPVIYDAVTMPVAMAVHHPDLDFYKQYYPHEVVTETMKNHMQVWHTQK